MKIVEGRRYWTYSSYFQIKTYLPTIVKYCSYGYSTWSYRKHTKHYGLDVSIITSDLAQALYGDL